MHSGAFLGLFLYKAPQFHNVEDMADLRERTARFEEGEKHRRERQDAA